MRVFLCNNDFAPTCQTKSLIGVALMENYPLILGMSKSVKHHSVGINVKQSEFKVFDWGSFYGIFENYLFISDV